MTDLAYQYCWERQQVADRIHALAAIERDAERAFALFVQPGSDLAKCMVRNDAIIKRAEAVWQQDAFTRALMHCDQLESGLIELRGMLRELGVMPPAYCKHMLDGIK